MASSPRIGRSSFTVSLTGAKSTVSVVFLAAFLFSAPAFGHSAEVENIPSDRYFEVTLNEIQQAKSSIRLTMYLVALPRKGSGSKVHRLLDALVEAAGRGVNVRVVLDRNASWIEKGNKNVVAYRYLQERGVGVFYDDENRLTHAKALVIDQKTVILGSTNWSESALTRNAEANVLIRSEELAREILNGFEEPVSRASETGSAVSVPLEFLNDRKLLGRMVTHKHERDFDLYLFLLKSFSGRRESELAFDHEDLRRELGIHQKDDRGNRRAVQRVLLRLRDRYGLIAYAWRGEGPVISLKTAGIFPERAVEISSAYWEWGWSKKLTFSGKVMYLLGEMYSPVSPTAPVWFRSEEDLAKTHGFSDGFIYKGMMDLRRRNLVEVKPDRLSPENYGSRKANRYTPNPLYDPKELEKAFQDLERRYGKEKLKRAVGILHLISEDSDVKAAERLILLEEEFGSEVVRKAVKKVGEMSGNNPKKTIAYLIATIQSIGSGAEQRGLTQSPRHSTL